MTRFSLIQASLLFGCASAFVAPPPSSQIRCIDNTGNLRASSSRSATPNKNAADDSTSNDEDKAEKQEALRKGLLGLTLPIAIALSANAPFIYVILNPPSPEERETMLMDFCQGDVCTLLGGGSGFVGGDRGGDLIGAEAMVAMPSLEEFEAIGGAGHRRRCGRY